uniref:carbohydrate sulfotransferase 7 n=1 Tax=Euleptes europaea TaxID=460621 RepID=UPI0025413727|nr:carbohydrate sulfotransferase 7 [Euleptes europaea]
MKRRRWRCALGLALYTLLLLLLVPYVLDSAGRGRASEGEAPPAPRRRCPGLQGALGEWSWAEEPPPPPSGGAARGPPSGNGTGAAPGSLAGGKRHIYVHATWRTGSSFVGELFNQHPDVFYLYEPAWHVWQALYPGDARSLQGALRDLLRSLFRCDFSALRLYAPSAAAALRPPAPGLPRPPVPRGNLSTASLFGWRTNKVICSAPLCPAAARPRGEVGLVDGAACERSCPPRALRDLEAECRKYPVVVIKDVRLLELGALLPLLRDPELDVRVLQLFRDPRAVHNSRLKARQALLRESVQVLRGGGRPPAPPRRPQQRAEAFLAGALEVICQAWRRDLLLARRAPPALRARYAQLRYEDLVREPRAQLRRLLRFAGLRAPPALQAFALDMTRGAAHDPRRPFLVSARDANHAVRAWRERLSRQQVRQVEEACGDAMQLLAYPLSDDGDARGRPSAPPHPG